MKYFESIDTYKWSKSSYHKKGERIYYFETNEWMYKVSIIDNNFRPDYPYIGFKAKKGDEYFYDMNVITNDDVYGIMRTIMDIIKYDFDVNDNKGFTFSLIGTKATQREKLYRSLMSIDWKITYLEDENKFLIDK